jgi:hypothetical protein
VRRIARRVAAVALVLTTAALAAQAPADHFAYERSIATSGAPPQRLRIDGPLLAGGSRFHVVTRGTTAVAEGGLADLRLFTESGSAVPYLLQSPPLPSPTWLRGTVLPIASTKKSSGFELDLRSIQEIDRLRVGPLPAPFLKRFSLEGSGDRAHWTVLAGDATLFDLPAEGLTQDSVAFKPGPYRYLRLTWDDANSSPLPLPDDAEARQFVRGVPIDETKLSAAVERRPSEPGVSRYRIRLPSAGLPVIALELEVGGGHLFRRAVVTEARFSGSEAAPFELGRATLVRVVRDGVTASAFRIPIAAPSEAEIDLTVTDEANPPIELQSVSLVQAHLPWIYFEAPAGRVVARYGNPALRPPSYDLEAVRGSIDLLSVKEATWGEVRALEPAAPPPLASPLQNAGSTLDAALFKTARRIDQAPAGLVALPLDAHAVTYSRGPSMRFADVRVLDASSRQIPYVVERRDEPLSVDVPLAPATSGAAAPQSSESRRQSAYSVTLPYPRMYPGVLVVETSARVFQRTVRVGFNRPADSRHRDPYFETQHEQVWRHADQQTAAAPLSLRLWTPAEQGLVLVVEEGDNASLPITRARLLLPSYRLRFYHPGEPSLRLVYGRDDLQSPEYDLALLASQVMGASAKEIGAAAPSAAAPSSTEPLLSRRMFWVILSAAVLILLAIIVRLIRSQETAL